MLRGLQKYYNKLYYYIVLSRFYLMLQKKKKKIFRSIYINTHNILVIVQVKQNRKRRVLQRACDCASTRF